MEYKILGLTVQTENDHFLNYFNLLCYNEVVILHVEALDITTWSIYFVSVLMDDASASCQLTFVNTFFNNKSFSAFKFFFCFYLSVLVDVHPQPSRQFEMLSQPTKIVLMLQHNRATRSCLTPPKFKHVTISGDLMLSHSFSVITSRMVLTSRQPSKWLIVFTLFEHGRLSTEDFTTTICIPGRGKHWDIGSLLPRFQ
jgi:hypothetical protein